ncbi:lipopolysaccharide biosynthesis protein [Rhizobium sp. SG2393]|uniref:lipopolysaccharide biosynthesis protein n=1 Tax=Rhizobium sp. SG2393 TaxID=3276279 RepID=UPI00366C589D
MSAVEPAEGLQRGLASKAFGIIAKVVDALRGNDARALAQRMALIAFAVRVLSAAIAFVSQIILARLMGEFEYGIFVFVWSLAVLFGNLSCFGFHSTIIRFLPGYGAAGATAEIRGIMATVRIFAMGAATVLATVGLAGIWLAGDLIEDYYLVPLYLGIFLLPMIALGDVMEGTARAHSWALRALSPTYIVRPLLILVFMMLFAASGEPHTAKIAMTAAMAATYVTSVGQYILLTRKLRRHYPRGPLAIDFATWLKVAAPIFLIEGFGFLLTNSDVIVVGLYLDPESVAIYFAAAKTMALVQFVMFSVKAASAPRFSAAMAEKDRGHLASIAVESARWAFWPSLGIGALVLLAGPFLLSLFGPAFHAGYPLMFILFTGMMAKALVGPAEAFLTMAGQQRLCAMLYATALIINVTLNVTLIPAFGLMGTAGATAGAMVCEALMLHLAVRRTFGITLFAFARLPAPSTSLKTGIS